MPNFKDLLYYDETSPTFLRWNIETYFKGSTTVKIQKGSIAGTIRGAKGVPHVKWKGKLYKCHRVVWVVNGNELLDDHVIDHIDGNVLNNKIDNLRQVDQLINSKNCKLSKNNTSGINGVYWANKLGKWIASGSYKQNGKYITKYLGCFIDIKDAEQARLRWQDEVGGFTERHGK